jgi:hypothetical protein
MYKIAGIEPAMLQPYHYRLICAEQLLTSHLPELVAVPEQLLQVLYFECFNY